MWVPEGCLDQGGGEGKEGWLGLGITTSVSTVMGGGKRSRALRPGGTRNQERAIAPV